MKHFAGRIAVITGAASGIGLALARRCAQEGMKVVLADVEAEALGEVRKELAAQGHTVLALETDVANASHIEDLAQQTIEHFGAIHLLFNNAGVGTGGPLWACTPADWEWVMGVNLWGVIHALRIFVPIMLAQKSECHIVNTASIAGLTSGRGMGIYRMTKHAVVSLSETLYCDLEGAGSSIGVSVLCPAFVRTRIMESNRNRPAHLANALESAPLTAYQQAMRKWFAESTERGMPPDEVAVRVFDAIRSNTFYVLPHDQYDEMIRERMTRILERGKPAIAPLPVLSSNSGNVEHRSP
jgi:NAD(P)-dependent dehydrogenase (short-subunit alcohol dehydrogenase family)